MAATNMEQDFRYEQPSVIKSYVWIIEWFDGKANIWRVLCDGDIVSAFNNRRSAQCESRYIKRCEGVKTRIRKYEEKKP